MKDFHIFPISNPLDLGGEISNIMKRPLSNFQKMLTHSLETLNQQLLKADQMAQEMMLGHVDVHQAMIAMEQAYLSLRLMIQIRNKIITAYEEIMRMQF